MAPLPSSLMRCPVCGGEFAPGAQFCPKDGVQLVAAAPDDPYIGQQILGHIEIRGLAGIGSMGRVYRAFQRGIDRDVAVKILHRELSANPQLVARFHREAKVASRLVHPNVVHVHLAGQLPDGALYIVMEYLNGKSLQTALAEAGDTFALERALRVTLQICDAAGEAHREGVIHRDIKPDNVMLVRRGDDNEFVKVLDFGIAHLSWSDPGTATAAGLIFGTARYISPEAAQGTPVGAASDVYSIATLLYQLLAGCTPFEADQAVALLVQHINSPPPPILTHHRARGVPRPIADVIMANLSKSPDARAPNAHEFGRALVAAAKESRLDIDQIVGPHRLTAARPTPSTPDVSTVVMTPHGFQPVVNTVAMPREPSWPNPTPPPATAEGSIAGASYDSAPRRAPAATGAPALASEFPPKGATAESYGLPRRGRTALVIVACFALGVGGAGGVAYQMHRTHAVPAGPTLEEITQRASEALLNRRWDSPKGDNVRDLTDDGLRRFPGARELRNVRELACDAIVRDARAKEAEGDLNEAKRLGRLAFELDPDDAEARALIAPPPVHAPDAGKPHAPPRAFTPPPHAPSAGSSAAAASSVPATSKSAPPAHPASSAKPAPSATSKTFM